MSSHGKHVLTEALALSERERGEIAARLIESLDAEEEEQGWAAAWEVEIGRRIEELDAGAPTVSWAEARRQIAGDTDANLGR